MACLHDHSCEEHDCGSEWSLYKHIDMPKAGRFSFQLFHDCNYLCSLWEHISALSCHFCCANYEAYSGSLSIQKDVSALNEAVPGSVKSVFKAWEARLDSSQGCLESNDGDPELLVFIPFTADVKLKSISVVGGTDGTSPSKMRAFINRVGIDFTDAQTMQPVQEWELAENVQGVLEYQTRYSRFQSVGNLTLHFPENFGGETTQICFIGLRGEATQLKRDAVAKVVYELMPNPSDHKVKNEAGGGVSQV